MSLVARLTAALALAAPPGLSSGDIEDDIGDTREAAVLIAVTDRPQPGVLFIVRPEGMRMHPGHLTLRVRDCLNNNHLQV